MTATDTCDICAHGDWPVATILTVVRAEDNHRRACQDCSERAQTNGRIVIWDDPWSDPHHEVNEPRAPQIAEHEEIAPGVYQLAGEHRVYAVPSASTDRTHTVIVNTRTGAMRCDGPHCDGRTCSHQKRVRAARAGF